VCFESDASYSFKDCSDQRAVVNGQSLEGFVCSLVIMFGPDGASCCSADKLGRCG